MTRAFVVVVVVGALTLLAAACSSSTSKQTRALDATAIPKTITVTSDAFADNGRIPRPNTCDGPGTAPTVSWGTVPPAAKSVAVVVDDPDASGGAPFLHWIVVGLPPAAGRVPSHAPGVHELDNGRSALGWTPPCPPAGSGTHHYRFAVYALRDYVCADNGDASNGQGCSPPASSQALDQIKDIAIAKGLLTGTYSR